MRCPWQWILSRGFFEAFFIFRNFGGGFFCRRGCIFLIVKIPLRIPFFKILSLKLAHFDGIEPDFG
jgi:hypothetical protein